MTCAMDTPTTTSETLGRASPVPRVWRVTSHMSHCRLTSTTRYRPPRAEREDEMKVTTIYGICTECGAHLTHRGFAPAHNCEAIATGETTVRRDRCTCGHARGSHDWHHNACHASSKCQCPKFDFAGR